MDDPNPKLTIVLMELFISLYVVALGAGLQYVSGREQLIPAIIVSVISFVWNTWREFRILKEI
jgi:hypothetical protein